MNFPVQKSDFNLIRGFPNVVQFFVRDVDRHIDYTLSNATLQLNIVDTNAQETLLTRTMTVIDAASALYSVSLQPTDTLNWQSGYLQYSVTVTRSGVEDVLWMDRNYSPYGYCRLIDGPLPGPPLPTTLTPSTFSLVDGYAVSNAVAGAAAMGCPDGLQTFSFYTNAYVANVAIQASYVTTPTTSMNDWFTVQYAQFIGNTGVTAVNVVDGNYLWLRVAMPTSNFVASPVSYELGLQPLAVPIGNVSQILYLN